MIAIRAEIADIGNARLDRTDNPLRNAPHTAREVTADEWTHAYTRRQAAFPLEWVGASKYWPPVKRVDSVYGDRNSDPVLCKIFELIPSVTTTEIELRRPEDGGGRNHSY